MNVRIKNNEILKIRNIFFGLPLKGTQSRHRTKFIKSLDSAYESYVEDRDELVKDYAKYEDGQIVNDGNNITLDIEKYPEAKDEIIALDYEDNIIEVLDPMKLLDVIDNMPIELSGNDALIIDTLADKLENSITE